MAIINPPVGGQARSIHVQQLINWLRGIPSYSEAVNFTGITSDSAHAVTAANRGAGGLALAAKNSNLTRTLFEVKEAGTIVRPNAGSGTVFRVRNFADDADLFAVNANGTIALGSGTAATLAGAETLTNKTLTTPSLDGPLLTSYAEYANQVSPPTAPAAGRLRVYEAADTLRYKTSANIVQTLATIDGSETLTSKTLTAPTLTNPIINTYADLNQAAAPASPGAGVTRLYSTVGSNLLTFKTSTAAKTLVDTDSIQTLSNKTIAGAAFAGVLLSAPDVTNYALFDQATNPGGTPAKLTVWADLSNNLRVTTPGGTPATILTSINTPVIAGNSWARTLLPA